MRVAKLFCGVSGSRHRGVLVGASSVTLLAKDFRSKGPRICRGQFAPRSWGMTASRRLASCTDVPRNGTRACSGRSPSRHDGRRMTKPVRPAFATKHLAGCVRPPAGHQGRKGDRGAMRAVHLGSAVDPQPVTLSLKVAERRDSLGQFAPTRPMWRIIIWVATAVFPAMSRGRRWGAISMSAVRGTADPFCSK
jgi:hypothetical protein